MKEPVPNCSICKWSRYGDVYLFGKETGGQEQVCLAMGNKCTGRVYNKRQCKKLFEIK